MWRCRLQRHISLMGALIFCVCYLHSALSVWGEIMILKYRFLFPGLPRPCCPKTTAKFHHSFTHFDENLYCLFLPLCVYVYLPLCLSVCLSVSLSLTHTHPHKHTHTSYLPLDWAYCLNSGYNTVVTNYQKLIIPRPNIARSLHKRLAAYQTAAWDSLVSVLHASLGCAREDAQYWWSTSL